MSPGQAKGLEGAWDLQLRRRVPPLDGGLMNCVAKKTGTGVWVWIGYTTERACW